MRLPHELVHLRVRREMHDDVGRRILDPADAALIGRVVAGEILQQCREGVRPPVLALVDPEDLVPVAEQPQSEVGADLPRGTGDEHAHRGQS